MSKSRNNAFSNKNLAPFLRARGVEQVIVGGFYTGACVLATLEGAFKSGFKTKHPGHLSSDGDLSLRLSPAARLA
jgi:nicotinamidase-related amidase